MLYWICQNTDKVPSLHHGTEWSLGGLCWADGQSLQPACLPVFHYTGSPRDSSSSHFTAQNWASFSHCHHFLTRKTTIVSDICTVQLTTNFSMALALDICAGSNDEILCNVFVCWEKKVISTSICYQDWRWITYKYPLPLWEMLSFYFFLNWLFSNILGPIIWSNVIQ